MKEVNGIELGRMIRAVYFAHGKGQQMSPEGWSFHSLIDVMLRVSEAVAFAHSKGSSTEI